MKHKILVTGATGNVGCEVVKGLLENGRPVVAGVLNMDDARCLFGDVDCQYFRFGDAETYAPAFQGVNKLFLMRPPQISNVERYLFPVIDYAKQAGVEQIVFLSLLGVEHNTIVPHHKVEKYLKTCGIPYTFVRPSFYMQNLNTTHRQEIKSQGVISVPVGNARTSFIDVRDIGAVAAKTLGEAGHTGRFYELTGGEALDYYYVAELFTEILGKTVTYTNPSIWGFIKSSRKQGVPFKFALVMAGLYTSTRFGMAERVTSDVQQLLGRPPITMRQYITDYAEMWL